MKFSNQKHADYLVKPDLRSVRNSATSKPKILKHCSCGTFFKSVLHSAINSYPHLFSRINGLVKKLTCKEDPRLDTWYSAIGLVEWISGMNLLDDDESYNKKQFDGFVDRAYKLTRVSCIFSCPNLLFMHCSRGLPIFENSIPAFTKPLSTQFFQRHQ